MSEHIDKTIADLQRKLAEQEDATRTLKIMINQLCSVVGRQPMYTDVEIQSTSKATTVRSDEFVGMPLATAAKRVLDLRKSAGQDPPATVREIYQALLDGGYAFDTKNEANALRSLRISLSKNTPVFYRLPTGKFGLIAWYGDKVKRQAKASKSDKDGESDSADEEIDDADIAESEESLIK